MSEPTEESGWLPPDAPADWPPSDTRQAIARRRNALREAMQRLEASAARASGQPNWASHVKIDLVGLKQALKAHVSEVEGPGGLFDDVIERAPHLAPRVEELRQQHQRLERDCFEATEWAVGASEVEPARLRRKVLIILRQLVEHRQDGAELLFDAYNVELAAGD